MLPITNRERETIIFHKINNEKNENIAKWVRVSISSITRIWKLYRTTGKYEPKPQNSGRKPLVSADQMSKVIEKIKEQPDIILRDLIDCFSLGISESALCRRLLSLGYTLKKRHSIR
jgi:transposase